ncbi:hypothetical protein CPB84DRAFT_1814898 [Gymnopilus junonius]|uniref:Uncharacterized protein n=1 Tax=Gymnopilus junonius TaxID=109634 RepID=A0A9P5TPY6_GYMJU|nr:hypothetical protein CPB84DRAFT_1814898 [Gymnopilus junonius]
MFSKAFVVLAFTSAAFANVFITAPVASTTYTAGQQATVQWQDDGHLLPSPTLTSLQLLNGSVDVSKVNSITFTPDATVGPNSGEYFIRVESLSLKDASQPQFPALAFSAKFTLAGMTGTFNAAVQSQIDGQTTAPLAAPTAASTAAITGASTTSTSTTSSSSSKKTSSTSAAPTASHSASSAMGVRAGWAGAILGAIVGVTVL